MPQSRSSRSGSRRVTGDDLLRAVNCLAAAALYEAGDDARGEAAVAQVVLNRVRHPAFPHSVCGVVFQGAERRTGCQFTFTCDGALARVARPEAWIRAQAVALAALTGTVDREVGFATHYHTDWVVPSWSGTLDKIGAVGTHLFFRWRGWWGTPPAFAAPALAAEPRIDRLARLSDVHKPSDQVAPLSLTAAIDAAAPGPDRDAGPAPLPTTIADEPSTPVTETAHPTTPMAASSIATPAEPSPPRRRRVDPCRAMRHVDERIGFCAGR